MKNNKDTMLNDIVFCPSDVIKGLSNSLAKLILEDNGYPNSAKITIGMWLIEGTMDYLASIHAERYNGTDRKENR